MSAGSRIISQPKRPSGGGVLKGEKHPWWEEKLAPEMAGGSQASKQPCRQVKIHKASPTIRLIKTQRPQQGAMCDTGNNQGILCREEGLHL